METLKFYPVIIVHKDKVWILKLMEVNLKQANTLICRSTIL